MAVLPELIELSHRVEEQLGRYGTAGRVEVEGQSLVLIGHGPRVLVAVGSELEGYVAAPERQRRLVVERLARELSSRRRASVLPARTRTNWFDWGRLLFGLAVTAGGLYVAWHWLGRPAQQAISLLSTAPSSVVAGHEAPPNVPVGTQSQITGAGESPAARCNAVRTRVSTGGSISPLDVDGWVVELMLLSPTTELNPRSNSLASFFRQVQLGSGLRVIWDEEPALRNAEGPDTWVLLTDEPLAGVLPQTRSGIRVAFTGRYVPLYFDQASRIALMRLASALYEASGANVGALYARCAAGRTHHLGSWFRGADWATTSLSLVASMGLYADRPHLFGAGLTEDAIAQRRVFTRFLDGSQKFTRDRVTMLLADDGGMLAARPGRWATFTFPFSDGNRATRTSLRMAKALGLGPSQ